MARAALLVALLAACLAFAAAAKDPPYNTVTAAANPENYKGYARWPYTMRELLNNPACATDDNIFNLDFMECNLWFLEELAAGKPVKSDVHCSESCAWEFGKMSRACYNQFRKDLTTSPTFKKQAAEFFGECDKKVPNLIFDDEKPKVEKGVNLGSVKGEQVQASSLAPSGTVDKKDTAADQAADQGADQLGADQGADGTADAASAEVLPVAEGVPTLIEVLGNNTALLGLLEQVNLVDDLENFNGTIFAPTEAAVASLLAQLPALKVNVTDELVTDILNYHLVPSARLTIQDLEIADTLSTALGQDLQVERTGDTITLVGVGSKATIEDEGTAAGQAVVYSIDTVLLPISVETPTAPEATPVAPAPSGAAAKAASAAVLAAAALFAALLM